MTTPCEHLCDDAFQFSDESLVGALVAQRVGLEIVDVQAARNRVELKRIRCILRRSASREKPQDSFEVAGLFTVDRPTVIHFRKRVN